MLPFEHGGLGFLHGDGVGPFRDPGLALGGGGLGRRQGGVARLPRLDLVGLGVAQRLALFAQALQGVGGIGREGLGPRLVLFDLDQMLARALLRLAHLGLFLLQGLPLQDQLLQRRPGGGRGGAQVGHGGGRLGLQGRRPPRVSGPRGDLLLHLRQGDPRLFQRFPRLLRLQVTGHRLVPPDVARQIAVAAGLPRLLLEPAQLRFEGLDDVVEALQVGLRRAQPQLGLVPAGVEAGDPGRLFQERAPVGRLGVDQGADTALADQRRRVGPGRGVGEQQLDVARPDVAAVDPVVGPVAPFDAPDHRQFVPVVQAGGRAAVAVVQGDLDLGDVAGRAPGAAREDHVLHLAAAHALGRGFPHGPAQRLDEIGLAAAVRPDDARQAGVDEDLCRIYKGLEARQTQLGELDHRRSAPLNAFDTAGDIEGRHDWVSISSSKASNFLVSSEPRTLRPLMTKLGVD